MQLAKIKGICSRFSNALSKFLGVDVLIVDNNLKTMGVTVSYFEQLYVIRRSSIIGQCIATKAPIAIEDRRKLYSCRNCPEYDICEMQGVLCAPILYQGDVIGAISFIVPRRRADLISKNLDNSIEVLQDMGAYLVSQLEKYDRRIELDVLQQEYKALADGVDEIIAVVDNSGIIEFGNKLFLETFCREHEGVGHSIFELIPQRVFMDCIGTENDIEGVPFFTESAETPLCGIMSSRTFRDNRMSAKKMLIFRTSTALAACGSKEQQTEEAVTFTWKQCQWYFSDEVVSQAKNCCNSSKPVLIVSAVGAQSQYLSKCIHNHSNRGGVHMHSIDCTRQVYTLEKDIFGKCGVLFLGNRSTVLLQNVERLPCYLQLKLANFLQTGILAWENHDIGRVDVRIICSISKITMDLLIPQLKAYFEKTTIEIPSLNADPAHLRSLILEELKHYKKCYHKPNVTLMDSALHCLCGYSWPGDYAELSQVMDRLVYCADGTIGVGDINPLLHVECGKSGTLEEVERGQIEQLLMQQYSKKEVAELLGISRATLYRKMKQYQLMQQSKKKE